MKGSKKLKWRQLCSARVQFPGLMDSPERWVIFVIFTTSKKNEEPFYGRLRVYALNSSEQVDKMLEENPDYIIRKNFLQDVQSAVQNGDLPLVDFPGLPPAEMLQDSEIGAYVALEIVQKMLAQEAEKEEGASAIGFVPWPTKKSDKPKA